MLGKQFSHLTGGGIEELPPWVDQVDPHVGEGLVESGLKPTASSLNTSAWTSYRNGTDASPSS